MTFFKVKIDQADKLFSEYIRKRDKCCVICGDVRNLTCSHFVSRRKEAGRFDTENCDTLCISCHMEYENEKGYTEGEIMGEKVTLPKKYTKWKIGQLGQQRFNSLLIRCNKTVKKDRKLQIIRIKELLKQQA